MATSNLLKNPGFESGSPGYYDVNFPNWSVSYDGYVAIALVSGGGSAHTGAYSATMGMHYQNFGTTLSQTVTVTPFTNYSLGFFVAPLQQNPGPEIITITVNGVSVPIQIIQYSSSSVYTPNADLWQKVVGSWYSGASSTATVTFNFAPYQPNPNGYQQTDWTDDYYFLPTSSLGKLFSGGSDTVDFNSVSAIATAVSNGADMYNGQGGSDTVTLPTAANIAALGWDLAFKTNSRPGDSYTVRGSDGSYVIQTGAGDDFVSLSGNGNSTIYAGTGAETVHITGNGANTIAGANPSYVGSNTFARYTSLVIFGLGQNTLTGNAIIGNFELGAGADLTIAGSAYVTDTIYNGGGGVVRIASGASFSVTSPSKVGLTVRFVDSGKFFGTNGDYDITGGTGTDTIVLTGAGKSTIAAGTGRETIDIEGNSSNTINAGASGGYNAITINGTGTNILAGTANVTSLNLAAGADLTVTGTTTLGTVKGAGTNVTLGKISIGSGATLRLSGSQSNITVEFDDGTGTLIIDGNPSQFKGTISNLQVGDKIVFNGTDLTKGDQNNWYEVAISATTSKLLMEGGVRYWSASDEVDHVKLTTSVSYNLSGDLKDVFFSAAKLKDPVTNATTGTQLTLTKGNPISLAMNGPGSPSYTSSANGNGVKIGVISGVHLHLNGFGGDEGTAMRDVIKSIAPGADVQVINVLDPDLGVYGNLRNLALTQQAVAKAIQDLQAAGCDIIVDDLNLLGEVNSSSTIGGAIDHAYLNNVAYFVSAGNYGLAPLAVYGHHADPLAITVGAINWLNTPYGTFSLRNEPYSSQGVSGSWKPDISAPDGGPTTVALDDLDPFFGTSAAAPAAAAVAALMLQVNPKLTPGDIRYFLEKSAIHYPDAGASGWGQTSGYGLIQANVAVALAKQDLLASAFYTAPGNPGGLAVASASISHSGGASATGLEVVLAVTLTKAVTVTGTPTLTLSDGSVATYDAAKSTPSTGLLAFVYDVGASDHATNLSVTGSNLSSSVTIKDATGSSVSLSALFNLQTNLSINSPLVVSSVSTQQTGEVSSGQTVNIRLLLNRSVSVNTSGGLPTLLLNDGATATYNAASSTPSSGLMVFDYVVGASDSTTNLAVAQVVLAAGTTVRDASGNNADFSAALGVNTGLQIGPVSAQFIAVSQSEANTGSTVQFAVQLSGQVSVNTSGGSPKLTLSSGGTATFDAAASQLSSGLLVFDYTVLSTDHATSVAATLSANGATIKDTNGVNAVLSAVTNAATGLTLNSPLTVTAVTAVPSSSNLTAGQTVLVSVTLSATASVSGTPSLLLNNGGQATYTGGDGTNVLTFSYKVADTDKGVASLAVTGINMNSSSIADSTGNVADFSHAFVALPNLSISHANIAPVVAGANILLAKNQTSIAASSLITASDPDGGSITKYAFWNSGTGGGHFVINGVALGTNTEIDLTPAQLAQTTYQAGTATDQIWAAAFDGTQWGGAPSGKWSPVFTVAPYSAGVVRLTVNDDPSAGAGEVIALSRLVTVADSDNVGYQRLQLWDTNGTVAGGQLIVDGVSQTGGHQIDIAPVDIGKVVFDAGEAGGTDTLWARLQLKDGSLTAWQQFSVTVPLPTVTAANYSNASRGQQIPLSSLITLANPSGAGWQQIEFWDSKGTPGGGQLVVNGIGQTGGHEIDVTPASVANSYFQVGSLGGTDTLWVRLRQSNGTVGGWQQFTVTAAGATAPSLTTHNVGNATNGQSISIGTLLTINDPAAVGYQQLQLWDSQGTKSGGQLVVGGVPQSGGHEIDVLPANVAGITFNAGTSGGTDTLWARLMENDGTFTAWQQFSVTEPAPIFSASSVLNATPGQIINLSSLLTISDPSNVGYKAINLYDSKGTVAGGEFFVNGLAQPGGQTIVVVPGSVSNTVFATGTAGGTDHLWARLMQNDGSFTSWQSFDVTAPSALFPTLTVSSISNGTIGSIAISNFVSIADPGHFGYQSLQLWHSTATGGGQLYVNGAPQPDNQAVNVLPAQLATTYFLDWGAGTSTFWARLVEADGTVSAWQSFSLTVPPPSLAVHDYANATPGQVIALSNLVTISDPGHTFFQQLQLWDSNGTVAGGQFKVNGVSQTGGHEIDVNYEDVSKTVFVEGTTGATDTLYARLLLNDDTLTGWQKFTVKDPLHIAAGATLELNTAYAGTVVFEGQDGTLLLHDSSSFTGTVAGMLGNDMIDFADINFATVQAANFTGDSSGGMLAISDGAHSATIALLGNYTTSTFATSSDGHGGTSIIEALAATGTSRQLQV